MYVIASFMVDRDRRLKNHKVGTLAASRHWCHTYRCSAKNATPRASTIELTYPLSAKRWGVFEDRKTCLMDRSDTCMCPGHFLYRLFKQLQIMNELGPKMQNVRGISKEQKADQAAKAEAVRLGVAGPGEARVAFCR